MKSLKLLVGVALLSQAVMAEPELIVKPPHVFPPVIGPVVVKTFNLSASDFAREVDTMLSRAKMKMNNHQTQSSYLEVRGVQFPFQIPRTTIDIDCGTFCPDLGDGHFYVNDVNLEKADFLLRSGAFELSLEFEDSGREIKGYHSLLGDNGMPDFQMNRMRMKIVALPVVNNGQVTLAFSNTNLTADIQSTGGCHIGGIDVCNKIFGSSRRIEKSVESTAQSALNGAMIQGVLKLAIRQYLSAKGVNGTVRSVALVGNDLRVTLQ